MTKHIAKLPVALVVLAATMLAFLTWCSGD